MHPLAKSVWDVTPSVVQDAIAMLVDRVTDADAPGEPELPPHGRARVLIGPANWAGQAYRWARAIEQNPDTVARNMISAEINGFGYDFDFAVRWRTMHHSRKWQREFLATVVEEFTHVMFEAQLPVLGGAFGGSVRRQAAALRAGGARVAMICHGHDIRLPSLHAAHEPWSPYANDDWQPVAPLEKMVRDNLALLDDVGAPIFVSTAGLLLDVPRAHFLPVIVDSRLWRTDAPVLERARPRVLHMPSNPVPKGTPLIMPTLTRLHEEGVIELIDAPLGLPHAAMPQLVASADIVLDQFRVGDYGVGACESMAAGRLVVSHVSDQVRGVVARHAERELPIVEADPDTLEVVLRRIAGNREHYQRVAAAGPGFVEALHDGRRSRAALEQHFLFL